MAEANEWRRDQANQENEMSGRSDSVLGCASEHRNVKSTDFQMESQLSRGESGQEPT
jgi:hypothetical protein